MKWIKGARDVHNVTVDYIGVSVLDSVIWNLLYKRNTGKTDLGHPDIDDIGKPLTTLSDRILIVLSKSVTNIAEKLPNRNQLMTFSELFSFDLRIDIYNVFLNRFGMKEGGTTTIFW
jgi:hypothetical protein